jgi:hypothetical protein
MFKNKIGKNLFGILHLPEEIKRDEAIILLSPGIKSRVAPHRLYVKMAAAFVNQGYAIFRFDYCGLGDSEGEIEQQYTADLYASIEVGRYIDDTICAMDFLNNEYKIKKFILSGLCGGAITGLLTSVKDKRVTALLGLALPIVLSGSSIAYDSFLTTNELKQKRSFYINKLFTSKAWRSWIRFFTFQSDYRLIFRSLFLTNGIEKFENSREKKETYEIKPQSIINPHFVPAFKKALQLEYNLLLIFAEADRHYWQFAENIIENGIINVREEKNIELHVIKEANHIFSLKNWQNELIEISGNWLNNQFNTKKIK